VLLEAMAFRTPIVSTNVNGIPEMLLNQVDARLVPAGDAQKLSAALRAALADLFAGDTRMVTRAHARVNRSFHLERLLPRHVKLCREAIASD
jgi:glycosyltransferase involved in cell wall biosynthesis